MKLNKYLFNPVNTPNCTKDLRNTMNSVQIDRMTLVSKWFLASKHRDDLDLYYSICDMIHDDVLVSMYYIGAKKKSC